MGKGHFRTLLRLFTGLGSLPGFLYFYSMAEKGTIRLPTVQKGKMNSDRNLQYRVMKWLKEKEGNRRAKKS
jgi:hypothetical protein